MTTRDYPPLSATLGYSSITLSGPRGRLWTSFAASGDPSEAEWPRFGAAGRNVLLQPQLAVEPGTPQRMQPEYALGREPFCAVWDEVDATERAAGAPSAVAKSTAG